MNNNTTAVVFTKDYVKDDADKVQMTRSHDTWVLLLVVSVLSTLLSVIMIMCCLWFCTKFCTNLSLLKSWRHLQCFPSFKPDFPPHPQREFLEMDQFSANIQPLNDRQAPKAYPPTNMGASEQLGYRPDNKNISLPALPTPRSWTPSPPFLQNNNSTLDINSNIHSSCRKCCRNQFHHCHTHRECYTNCIGTPHCQFCPYERKKRLASSKNCCRDVTTPRKDKKKLSRYHRTTFHSPYNLPAAVNLVIPSPCHDTSVSSIVNKVENEKSDNDAVNSINSHSNTSRHRQSFVENMFNDKNSILQVNNRKSPTLNQGAENLNSLAIPVHKKEHNFNHDETPFERKGIQKGNIHKKYFNRKIGKSKEQKRYSSPVPVLLGSPSSGSSDPHSALNRSSRTYWKLYHPANINKATQGEYEEEEAKYDAAPSMSWDHLALDTCPSSEKFEEAKAEIDPNNTTVIFHHEKKLEELREDNIAKISPTSSPVKET